MDWMFSFHSNTYTEVLTSNIFGDETSKEVVKVKWGH